MKLFCCFFYLLFGVFHSCYSQKSNNLEYVEVYKWLPYNIQERRIPFSTCQELKQSIKELKESETDGSIKIFHTDSIIWRIDSAYTQNKIIHNIIVGDKREYKCKKREKHAVDIRMVFVLNYSKRVVDVGFSYPGVMVVNGTKYKIDKNLYNFSLHILK